MAIKPSLIHSKSGFATANDPKLICTGIFSRSSYACRSGELLQISASAAAATSSKPPADSSLRKSAMPSVPLRITLPITIPGPLSAHQLVKAKAGAEFCVQSGAAFLLHFFYT